MTWGPLGCPLWAPSVASGIPAAQRGPGLTAPPRPTRVPPGPLVAVWPWTSHLGFLGPGILTEFKGCVSKRWSRTAVQHGWRRCRDTRGPPSPWASAGSVPAPLREQHCCGEAGSPQAGSVGYELRPPVTPQPPTGSS